MIEKISNIMWIIIFININVMADSAAQIFFEGCNDKLNNKRTTPYYFLQGYVNGYSNSFRYQMRDFKMKINYSADENKICENFLEVYLKSIHEKTFNATLTLNVFIEMNTLNINGYSYDEYTQKRNKIKEVIK